MPDVFELIGATWTFLIRPQLNFRNFCGVVCAFFIGWNLTKLPYYWPYGETAPAMTDVTYDPAVCEAEAPPTQCYGLEFQANLAAWMPGYRAYKLVTDPNLFLAPHVAMDADYLRRGDGHGTCVPHAASVEGNLISFSPSTSVSLAGQRAGAHSNSSAYQGQRHSTSSGGRSFLVASTYFASRSSARLSATGRTES